MEKERWFLLGDIHGKPEVIRNFYEKNKERLQLDTGDNWGMWGQIMRCRASRTQGLRRHFPGIRLPTSASEEIMRQECRR